MLVLKYVFVLSIIYQSCHSLLHISQLKSFVKSIRNTAGKMVSIDWNHQVSNNIDSEDAINYAHDEVTCKSY